MNQPAPDELISAYFDGEVTPEECQQAEDLLETSDDLRQLLDDTAKLSALLHSFPRESAPAQLAQSILRSVNSLPVSTCATKSTSRHSLRREWMAFGAGMLATMATLLLVYVTLDQPHQFAQGLKINRAEPERLRKLGDLNQPVALDGERGVDVSWADQSPAATMNAPENPTATTSSDSISLHDGGVSEELKDSSNQVANGGAGAPVPGVLTNETPDFQDYFWSLKHGDLIVRQVVDADDAVAVVKFQVVDVEKAIDGITLLLQQKDIQKVEGLTTLGRSSLKAEAYFEKADEDAAKLVTKRSKNDDLVVVYVRATGDRLAGTIKALKDHPEICKNFETDLPIGLPLLASKESAKDAIQDRDEKSPLSESNANVPPPVLEEGKLAVNSYALNNGLATSPVKAVVVEERLLRRNVEADKSSVDKSSEGYAAFRFATEQQLKSKAQAATGPSQPLASAKRSAMSADANANFGLNPLQNQMANQASNLRYKSNRAATDQRDARLIRMLIVLKPEVNVSNP